MNAEVFACEDSDAAWLGTLGIAMCLLSCPLLEFRGLEMALHVWAEIKWINLPSLKWRGRPLMPQAVIQPSKENGLGSIF